MRIEEREFYKPSLSFFCPFQLLPVFLAPIQQQRVRFQQCFEGQRQCILSCYCSLSLEVDRTEDPVFTCNDIFWIYFVCCEFAFFFSFMHPIYFLIFLAITDFIENF